MSYNAVVISGTSASGKTALVRRVCDRDQRFAAAQAVTTRSPRPDDAPNAFRYLSQTEFAGLQNDLFVESTYRGERYGIERTEFERIRAQRRVPMLTITPESSERLTTAVGTGSIRRPNREYLSIFLDAPDVELDRRFAQRGTYVTERIREQRAEDRKFGNATIYRLSNTELESVSELVIALCDATDTGGLVPARIIELMLKCGTLLSEADVDRIQGASYDLSLGDEYFYGGKIRSLSATDPILTIEPYDYAIVTSRKVADLPHDVSGRFGLTVRLFCQGIILSNGPQIDPGFRGPLFCLLLNTSSDPVLLKRGQHYATIEFQKLWEPTYAYHGQYREQSLLHYLPANAARGAINELKRDLDQVRKESSNIQGIVLGFISLVLALMALLIALK